jgi:hypothetical protein
MILSVWAGITPVTQTLFACPLRRQELAMMPKTEKLQFVLELRQGGGFKATALGQPLSAEGHDLDDLHRNVSQAVRLYFGADREIAILAGLPTRPSDN